MRRLTLALVAIGAATAFAPAPLPKSPRGDRQEMSLRWCQGTWEVLDNESIEGPRKRRSPWSVDQIRISGSRWTLMSNGRDVVSYTLAVDGKPRPAHIDWYPLDQPQAQTLWTGLIKREGDKVLILYSDGGSPDNRARDFDSARGGSFLITVRRGR